MSKKEIRIRCWIDIDGVRFFGPGRAELLGLIDEKGSISQAAKRMGMSYKKAWAMVNEMNTQGSKPLVVSQKGGDKGGGARLTESGKKIVSRYLHLTAKLDAIVEKNKEILKLI
jgi:molybdate transport system regulatory protein